MGERREDKPCRIEDKGAFDKRHDLSSQRMDQDTREEAKEDDTSSISEADTETANTVVERRHAPCDGDDQNVE